MLRVIACVLASTVAHVVLVGAALALALPSGIGARAPLDPVEITVLASPEDPDPREEPTVAPPERHELPQAASVPPQDRRHVPRSAERVSTTVNPAVEEPAPSIMVPQIPNEPAASEADRQRDQRRMAVLLNPSNVARSSWDFAGQGPSMPGPPAGRTLDSGRPTERELEAEIGGGLRREAMQKRHVTRTRPEFRRQSDGTYVFAGHVLTARIDRCGDLSFVDRPGIETNGFSASGSFDLEGAIMGAQGQDPHAAERAWVAEHSEELRDSLDDSCRAEQMAAALRRLRGRLASTWSRTERSASSRRRHMFDLWDETEEGADGARARAVVIEFIRTALPAGSEDAYPPEEIERLNARRTLTTERFAPY
jgi:hypothetical protein